jgi:hypothetical protein
MAGLPSKIIAEIAFVGRSSGAVKALEGFKKGFHTVPDASNPTTNAFLGKICEPELAAQAEAWFQRVRMGLGYTRKKISLSVAGGAAVLTAKDFTVEIVYRLEDADPSRYEVVTTLREVRSADLMRTAEFTALFERAFTEILFVLTKGASVEAVIDAIEALDEESGLSVTYPSDCRECVIQVEGVDAQVRCTGAALDLIFPQAASPQELLEAFAEIRAAFAISPALSGLIG